MRYSKMFGKTRKNSKDLASVNATLLTRAGYVDQVMAGVYTYLPLGNRVLTKIEDIIRQEMDKISDELLLTCLSPVENWKISNRYDEVDVLLKAVPANGNSAERHDAEYIINPTNEDTITPLVRDFAPSYKDLPIAVYQIQTKFRNEPRARSGILRGREFRMKDLYSFHTDQKDLYQYYERAKEAYWRVYERLGLKDQTELTLASGGDFTKEYTHEFQTRCDAGEDLIFKVLSSGVCYNKEVAPSKAPAVQTDEPLAEMEEVEGVDLIGVEPLAKFLNIPVSKTTKTMLFAADDGRVIAAAVRGGYDVDVLKLRAIVNAKTLTLASEETVRRVTKSEVGYAGLLNLPSDVEIVVDESCAGRVNFEMGANRTHYHSINVNWGRDLPVPEKFYDIKVAKEGDAFPETGEVYETFKACEVGNIFPLMTKFSDAFGYTFADEDGSQKPVYMGSYGLGSTRVMGVIVENNHDDKGIIWPASIAPFEYHLVTLAKNREDEAYQKSEQLYKQLGEAGHDVLWDDRFEVSAGEKFADADLIGVPTRLVVSEKSLAAGGVEVKKRSESESKVVSLDEVA